MPSRKRRGDVFKKTCFGRALQRSFLLFFMGEHNGLKKINMDQVFGATDVMGAAGCKRTAASSILDQMYELGVIEKISGHGKGKSRFKG